MDYPQDKEFTIPNIKPFPVWAWGGQLLKRSFDVIASALGLLILFPLFLIIAGVIKRESPGPVYFRGPRLGRNGKPFGILKFRTMYEKAASYAGPSVTAHDDGRITPLGKWLRATKLNELPQLWNVFKGEMSMVGPRPEDPQIARNWPAPMRTEILSVRPGITSPASIIYRDEEKLLKSASVMDDYLKDILPDKLRLDQLYVRNRNFLSDLDVIFMTFLALLPILRQNPIPIETLYNGFLYRLTRRYFSWFIVDILISFTAVSLAGVIWRMSEPLNLGLQDSIAVAVGIALVFSCVNTFLGLGHVWWRYAQPATAFDLALSSGISTLLIAILDWRWLRGPFLPLNMLIVTGLLAFLGFVSIRYRERLLTGLAMRWFSHRGNKAGMRERVLIVGAGECGLLGAWLLQRSNFSSAFSIVGMVDDDPHKEGLTIDGHRVFGLTRRIPELVQQQDIGVILFAIDEIQPDEQARILNLCRQMKARIVLVPDLLSIFRERLSQSSAKAA